MASGAVLLTALSESVVSAVRNNPSTSFKRAKTRTRKTKNTEKRRVQGLSAAQYKKLTTQLLLHADTIHSGVIVNVVKSDDTTALVVLPEDARISAISQQVYSTELIKENCLRGEDRQKKSKESTTPHQAFLALKPPRFIRSNLKMTSPHYLMTSPHYLMTSSQHVRMLHTRTGSRTAPSHRATKTRAPSMAGIIYAKLEALTGLRGSRGGREQYGMELLEGVMGARALFERHPTQENARMVIRQEMLVLTSAELAHVIPHLKMRVENEPKNAELQSMLLIALFLWDVTPLEHIIKSRSIPLTPVTVGLIQDTLGFRDLRKFKKEDRPSRIQNLSTWGESLGGVMRTIFYCVMLVIVYNSINLAARRGGGSPLGSLLGEETSFEVTTPDVTFEDVAGNEHVMEEMEELVGYLTDPAKYVEMGCAIPKGYLLCGPPGVGKTLMAKALAGEAGVPFYYASGSNFEEIFVGVGAGRVRKMFEGAQANAPAIIFIDEIDSIGQKRKINDLGYSNRATLNQMLSCMDGFEDNNGVIVIAATNEPETLDSALTREGRFDTKISIRAPTLQGRIAILKVHTRNKTLAEDVDLENIATACTQMTGAQLATLVNTAALRAVLEKRDIISQDDFEFARARLLIGHVNEDIEVSDTELLNTAAHEAGHALLTVLREDITQRPVYISTILPRGNSLGHVLPVSKKDQHTQTIAQMIAHIDIAMAGRVGEELHHNFAKDKVSTGCSSDMRSATYYAEVLIKKCGYSNRIGLTKASDEKSDLTEKIVHEEIKKLFDERYQIVKNDMLKHKKEWKALTDLLFQYKTLTGGEVKIILSGGVPDRQPGDMLPST